MNFINIDYIIYLNLFFVSILLLLFVYLILNKLKDIKYENTKKAVAKELKPKIQAYIFSMDTYPSRLIPKDKLGVEILEETLSELGALVKDSGSQDKINNLAKEILSPFYFKRLENSKWSVRMNTYFVIENFLLDNLEGVLWKKFSSKQFANEEEKYQQMKTLATLHSEELMEYILQTKEEFPKFLYKEIIRRYDEEPFLRLVERYHEIPVTFKLAVMEMIGEWKSYQHYSLLEQGLRDTNIEIRLTSLKMLASFGYVSNLDTISDFANSEYFAERMLFAKLCALLKKERFKGSLVQLLSDNNWFVRNAAGEAIIQLPDGDIILSHIIETHEDPFARDMAEQWIMR